MRWGGALHEGHAGASPYHSITVDDTDVDMSAAHAAVTQTYLIPGGDLGIFVRRSAVPEIEAVGLGDPYRPTAAGDRPRAHEYESDESRGRAHRHDSGQTRVGALRPR